MPQERNNRIVKWVKGLLPFYLFTFLLFYFFTACRNDVMVVPMEDINTGGKTVKSEIIGMYLSLIHI